MCIIQQRPCRRRQRNLRSSESCLLTNAFVLFLCSPVFEVIVFGDDCILHQPIEEWPVVDVLIAFFSKGYPLAKAEEYVALRKPFLINNLAEQRCLQDRRRVYDMLEASGIDTPRHAFLSRDGYVSTGTGDGNARSELQEFDDHIVCNGITIHKPFVEKPVNAEGMLCVCVCVAILVGLSRMVACRLERTAARRASSNSPHVVCCMILSVPIDRPQHCDLLSNE